MIVSVYVLMVTLVEVSFTVSVVDKSVEINDSMIV